MDILKKVINEPHGGPFEAETEARLEAYLAAAAQRGASEALKAIGLNDADAAADIRDIRDLLRGLRIFRRAAWTTALTALGRVIGWVLVVALAALFVNSRAAEKVATMLRG